MVLLFVIELLDSFSSPSCESSLSNRLGETSDELDNLLLLRCFKNFNGLSTLEFFVELSSLFELSNTSFS